MAPPASGGSRFRGAAERSTTYKEKVFAKARGLIVGNYALDTSDPHRKGSDPSPSASMGNPIVYWISGPKKDGNDRLFGNAPVVVDPDVAEEYWGKIRGVKI
jgi:hypothetical protein